MSPCVPEEPEPRGSTEGAGILCFALVKTPCLAPSAETLPLTGVDVRLHRRLLALVLKVWRATVSRVPESDLLSQPPISWHQRYPETSRKSFPVQCGQHQETELCECKLQEFLFRPGEAQLEAHVLKRLAGGPCVQGQCGQLSVKPVRLVTQCRIGSLGKTGNV